jgi:hypothetical protein
MQKEQHQLLDLKKQLDNVIKRKGEIAARLEKLIPEGHAHRAALLAVFNRKLKRRTRAAGADDDSSSDDGEGDDDDSDEDGQQEVCPLGCSQAVYDEVRDSNRRAPGPDMKPCMLMRFALVGRLCIVQYSTRTSAKNVLALRSD